MSKVFGVALGILGAIGGFVDIGDLVFNVAAGATFGYQLLSGLPYRCCTPTSRSACWARR